MYFNQNPGHPLVDYMHFNQIPRTSVGADLSRPPPMYRPANVAPIADSSTLAGFSTLPMNVFITIIYVPTCKAFLNIARLPAHPASAAHLLRLCHQLSELLWSNSEMKNFGDMVGP
jgi:hypothetical protein